MDNLSPYQLRKRIKTEQFTGTTSGLANGYVQCNLVILPQAFADSFELFCRQNAQACPLISKSQTPGEFLFPDLGHKLDIRTDIPKYRIYQHGQLISETANITDYWREDSVAFLLGCSFSFEEALIAAGIEIRNITENKNVPMYTTNIANKAVTPFAGNMVVSMRPMSMEDALKAVEICSHYPRVHGAPVHIGDPAAIGINDISNPDFGDAVTINEGEVCVFWACGVTPQVALMQAKLPEAITHSPGYMLVTDILNTSLQQEA
ncbi:putative hydro-lyase [Paraferrimonas sp. SM1919]|uniref:putative hydro-lyase n=1 Tax=Paraferrimonas sp. SM1919 TaxID=2662263 RepID=UPI0013D25558|nr:putative hydro-lyase [Paraferrimonas sp. SM1919]